MSKYGYLCCGFSNHFFLILLGIIITACPQADAQFNKSHGIPREFQQVMRTYPITGVYAEVAERAVTDVFKQRPISAAVNTRQNTVIVWGTDAEHAQIEYFLKQNNCLGMKPASETLPENLIAVAQRKRNAGNVDTPGQTTRFANVQTSDAGQTVHAHWQSQNSAQQQPIRQVAGQQLPLPPMVGTQAVAASPLSGSQPATLSQQMPNNLVPQHIPLRNLTAANFEANLLNALQGRVQPQRTVMGNQTVYSIPIPNSNQRIDATIDRQSNIVSLLGTRADIETFAQIVQMLDVQPQQDVVTGVVPVTRGNAQPFQNFARLVNQSTNQFATVPASPQSAQGSELRFGNTTNPANETGGPMVQPDVSALVGPVEVTIMDGAVFVKARTPGDLALVMEIINYIEVMSREYEPVIVQVPMIHTDCIRVTGVALQVFNDWFVNQRGQVTAIPLVRPNAILLVGYPGSIEKMQDLIAKLDTRGDETQVQIFPLRFVSAFNLSTTLNNIFAARMQTQTVPNVTSGINLVSPVSITYDAGTNSLLVMASPRDMLEVQGIITKLDKANNEVEMEVRVFPLYHTVATTLANTINQALLTQTVGAALGGLGGQQSVTPPQPGTISFTTVDPRQRLSVSGAGLFVGVSVAADANGNNLIVKAPPSCMPVIEAIIRSLDDSPTAVAQIKVFMIINSDAPTLQTMLNQIFNLTGAGGGAGGGTTATSLRIGESTTENSMMIPVRFASDARTNSIIGIGSADTLAMVEAILMTLDGPEVQNRRVAVYKLLNTQASTIATTLTTFLQNERQVRQQSNIGVGEVDIFNSEVIITAETSTNSLLVSTTQRQFDTLRKMIQVLDERPAMVQISVLIGEVDISNAKELGFELGLQDSVLFNRGVLGANDYQVRNVTTNIPGIGQTTEQIIISESRQPGYNFNNTTLNLGNNSGSLGQPSTVGSQGITNLGLGRQNSELGYGGFVFSASSESVSVLVRALEDSRKMTVLNKPTLHVLHNQQAYITVGESVPTITGTSITETGSQSNTLTDRTVGITLTVTPRINLDDSVAMQINAIKSSLGPEQDGTPVFVQNGVTIRSPRTKQAEINTTIIAKSGQVAVLGGLINQEDSTVHRAVPGISRIPLLGQLFQYNNKQSSRKEVIFIFTPQVYRSDEEADALKHLELMRMHWCSTNVAALMNTESNVRTRFDDYNSASSDTVIQQGGSVRPDKDLFPSEKPIMEAPGLPNRPLTAPQPNLAPSFPRPTM